MQRQAGKHRQRRTVAQPAKRQHPRRTHRPRAATFQRPVQH
ncbi:hypothetical protein [Limosilactobacillus reuteri]|nr:hypothetical protein [Limosilactobacillus reuteri]